MIVGQKVRLRAIERADLARFVVWLNDAEVRRGISQSFPVSQVLEERWFDSMLELAREEQPFAVDVRRGRRWIHAGSCGLFRFDRQARSAELGIMLGEKTLWGRGYGTDTMRILVRHGFDTLNLNRIYLRVYESNLRAMRVYDRLGFREEGRLRQDHYVDGEYEETVIMGLLREEWRPTARDGR